MVDTLGFEQKYSGRATGRSLRGGATLLAALMAALVQQAHAQDAFILKGSSSVTVYGGDRFAGSLKDSTTNSSIDLQNGSSFALA